MSICEDCVMRLFNTKNYNLHGIGNPYFGKCIIVPNVDYNAYKKGDMGFSSQVGIIEDVLLSTGEVNNLYFLPLIRCSDKLGCEITDDVYNRCITYFAEDIKRFNFTDIMLLGDAGRRFLHCDIKSNIDKVFISRNKRRYSLNYSPLTKYVNEDLFDTFKQILLKWVEPFPYCYSGKIIERV